MNSSAYPYSRKRKHFSFSYEWLNGFTPFLSAYRQIPPVVTLSSRRDRNAYEVLKPHTTGSTFNPGLFISAKTNGIWPAIESHTRATTLVKNVRLRSDQRIIERRLLPTSIYFALCLAQFLLMSIYWYRHTYTHHHHISSLKVFKWYTGRNYPCLLCMPRFNKMLSHIHIASIMLFACRLKRGITRYYFHKYRFRHFNNKG